MKLNSLLFFWIIILVSCQTNEPISKKFFNIDSLIDSQVNYLVASKASITKFAAVDTANDKSTFKPDKEGWENELAVFRQLELINKPIYAQAYEQIDGGKDAHSNLKVRTYRAKYEAPIREFKLFYLDHPSQVRKIEARISEQNSLYYSSRSFKIELDDRDNQMTLTHFNVQGIQKMILRDSVKFSITSSINY